jgi:hypothetical protein
MSDGASPRVVRGPLAAWFLAGCGLVLATQGVHLAEHDFSPTILLQVGAPSPARARLERELGPVTLAAGQGHDGKYFYLVARNPWFWAADPELLEGLQDPAYRYGRPLYPLLAGLGGVLSPRATLAGLVAVQVLAGGLFAAALVLLARQNGLPALAVLLGLGTPCLYSSAVSLTSDLLALTLSLFGVLLWQRGRLGWCVVLFAASVLAKEYYALTPLALAASSFRERPRAALAVAVLPLVPLALWRLAVASVLGLGHGGGNFAWPGEGILDVAASWANPAAGLLAVLVVVVSLGAVARPGRPLPRWQCLAWGVLGLCTSHLVWFDPADILRVISPAWWYSVWCWYPRPPGGK